ncbi:mucin-3A-like [Colletes gigas]|uniref:mucin-3A-like n=1 Tax=Colletes gigas TaxID=935657 RepID=UPI001C9B1F26|nr:mucin-3A-like [Colletes gigas]
MCDLGNRGVVASVSVLSGCVFLYNVWGPILLLTVSLFLTIYACYSLITSDSLFSPHAFLLFDYCKHVTLEVRASIENIVGHVSQYARTLWETGSRRFRELNLTKTKMERCRGAHYQLSSDPYPNRRNSSNFASISQLSPILRTAQNSDANDAKPESKTYRNSDYSSYDRNLFNKHSSTPIFPRNKEEFENEADESVSSGQAIWKRTSPYSQNHTLSQGENTMYYTMEGSPWGTNIGPKVQSKTSSVETGRAVSGPLSTSTRYNIDPRVYNDVTSPGLTGRLTKYAAEANNTLSHQARYRIGEFPKVNLQASSVPLINPKIVKTRTPMIVRVASPDAVRCSPPGKQKILTDLCDMDSGCSSLSVVQTLRDISLKRHASREDVAADLAKKQRTGGFAANEFEMQDETKQKRSREDSSKSEEEISPQNKTVRPTKRTKTPSCYDILNSFSSSKHVASGVKRKAGDLSRSGTPDFEKHFKSLECVQSSGAQTLPEVQNINVKHRNHETMEKKHSDACSPYDKLQEQAPLKGILKTSAESVEINSHNDVNAKHRNVYNGKDQSTGSDTSMESTTLTNKLFMRAEPERNEKLRMLVEEQGNIRAKFTTDDVEEIKMEDIADMRQTSMKARLQSMFDAISGKASSKINPDVVIQAEELNTVKSVSCPVTCATLNSSTTTTNVNTTPISTSALALSPGSSESHSKSPKHVAFNLPTKQMSTNSTALVSSTTCETKIDDTNKSNSTIDTSGITFPSTSTITPVPTDSNINVTSSDPIVAKNVEFGKSPSVTATNASSLGTFTFGAAYPSNNVSVPATSLLATSTSTPSTSLFGNVSNPAPKPASTSATYGTLDMKNETNRNNSMLGLKATGSVPSSSTPMLGGITSVSTPLIATTVQKDKEQTTETSFVSVGGSTMATNCTAGAVPTGLQQVTASSATTTAAPMFAFGSKSSNAPTSKTETSLFGNPGGNSVQSNSTFGSLTRPQQLSIIGNATTSTSCTSSQSTPAPNIVTSIAFNSNAKTTAPATFGSSSAFTFVPSSLSPASSKPGFNFAGTAPSATNRTTGAFGTTVFAAGNNVSTPTFGTSSASSARQFNSSATPIFGNALTASTAPTSSIFGTTNSQPIFGTASSLNTIGAGSFAPPKTTATAIFGSIGGSTTSGSTSTSSTPAFSTITGRSTSGTTNTTSMPIFASGANISASGATGTSSYLFSNANSTTSTPTPAFGAASNIFGQTEPAATNFKSTVGVFGNNATTLFGSQTTTAPPFGGTSNVSSNTTPVFSNATVPSFGAQITTSSSFGGAQSNAASAQSPASQTFGAKSSIFGANNVTVTPVFGASSNEAFNSAAPNSFGDQNATSGTFAGTKPSPFGAQTSAFGAPNSSTAAFGTGNAANTAANNTTSIFTFGANQNSPQQNLNTTFSFASNSNANNNAVASTSAPFQFSATTSKPATGFNFSAPSSTPSINFGTTNVPMFNAPTPGIFSIGSGSTAPRTRNVRTRKPR